MMSKLNCTRFLDEKHDRQWEVTHAFIKKEHRSLQEDFPDIAQVELHLRAFSHKTEAHLQMQDKNEIPIEVRADSDDLEVAVSLAFQRAKHQLSEMLSY